MTTPDDHDPDGPGMASQGAAGRVWLCAQRSPAAQRAGWFTPESLAHPARMLPDLATAAIEAYTLPGEWVLDPMCGIGTTLVSAVRAGRRALGVELEPRWVRVAGENLDLARADGHTATAGVVRGDARHLPDLIPELMRGLAPGSVEAPSLVLTSPPYGAGVHGQITHRGAGDRIVKYDHRYAPARSRANLAHTPDQITAGMTEILRAAAAVVRPGGHVVVVSRPWRCAGVLVDLPGQMAACARAAGLVAVDRAVALLARIDHTITDHDPTDENPAGEIGPGRLVARSSFFARHNLTRARAAGLPIHLIAHEDVQAFIRHPAAPGGGPGGGLGGRGQR